MGRGKIDKLPIWNIYNSDEVNNITKAEDAAKWINEHFDEWTLELIKRDVYKKGRKQYRTAGHDGIGRFYSTRFEEIMVGYGLVNAGQLVRNLTINDVVLGRVLDYQVPMKINDESQVGKAIDVISYEETNRIFHCIEAKWVGSKETLLRCITEAFTYALSINVSSLIKEYGYSISQDSVLTISITPFFFKGYTKTTKDGQNVLCRQSQASKDFNAYKKGRLTEVEKLVKKIEGFRDINRPKIRYMVSFVECDPEEYGYKPIFSKYES